MLNTPLQMVLVMLAGLVNEEQRTAQTPWQEAVAPDEDGFAGSYVSGARKV